MYGLESDSVIVGRLLEFTSSKQASSQAINEIVERTIEKIKDGSVHFSQEALNIEEMIDSKIKEMALAKIQSSADYSNYQRDLKIMSCINRSSLRLATPIKMADRVKMKKNEEKTKKKKEDEQKKRNFMMKMKEWQAQKAELLRRKKRHEEKQKSLDVSAEQQKKKEQKQEEDFLQLFKKKSIEGKIRQISKRKEERSKEKLHLSEVKQKPQQKQEYRYIKAKEIQSMQEAKRQQQKRKILHERSKSLELKLNEIVEHEKAYINKIKERLKMKQPENSRILEQSSSKNKILDSFNIHKKDPEKQKEILQKIRRMKEVQQKIQLMPLKISQQKRKQKEIMSDKLKNRKKYHFLSQKALRDSQIYQEFKDFDINIDKKDVGNHYFQEFKQQNQRYGRGKIQSEQLISINKVSSGQERQKKPKKKTILNADELDIIARRISKRKSFDYEEVQPGSTPKKFQEEIMKTIKTRSFHNFVNKQL